MCMNNIDYKMGDRNYKYKSKQIDSIAATNGIMNHIEGCRLINYNDIVESNHCAYMIDVDIKEFLKEEFSRWENANQVILNPTSNQLLTLTFTILQ